MIVHHFSPVTGALHPVFVFGGACRGVHSKFLLNWVEIKKKKKIQPRPFSCIQQFMQEENTTD